MSATALRCGLANARKLRIVSFSRSDSRSTMSISCDWSVVSGSSSRRIWIDPAIDASGLRISWAMPAAISPTAASRCCIARFAVLLLQLRDVLEREQEPALAARRDQRRAGHAELDLAARRGAGSRYSSRCCAARGAPAANRPCSAAGSCSTSSALEPHAVVHRHAGDRFGGAVEREQPPLHVAGRQAARQAVDDVLVERLQVGELVEVSASCAPVRRSPSAR